MRPLEEHFAEVESAATALEKAISGAIESVKQLRKAAKTGDLMDVKRSLQRVSSTLHGMLAFEMGLREAWPLSESNEEALLQEQYPAELLEFLRRSGVPAFAHGPDLMTFPFVLRILPKERAIRINGKKSGVLRPSALRDLLNRNRKPKFPNEKLLEMIYAAYRVVVGEQGGGRAATLRRIYDALTLIPGSENDYSEAEFVRDIYAVDRDGPHQTRSGARVSLVGSTGTRNKRDVFSFVGPDGELVEYFGVQFTELAE